MNWKMKIGWLYGLLAMIVSSFVPSTGVVHMIFTGILLFILWCFDINAKQRVKYYKEPEKLYKIGQNLPYAETIHKIQLMAIPYTVKGIFLGEKFIAILPLLLGILMGILCTALQVDYIKHYDYYQSMALFQVIPTKYWFIIGIPLQILSIFLLYLMARSFWMRVDYYIYMMEGDRKDE